MKPVYWLRCTHWQDNVHHIHDTQNDCSDSHVVVAIRQEQKHCCEDVVGEHLRIILALLLNVHDNDLLNPEAPLDEVIPLKDAFHFSKGPACPETVEVQPILGCVYYVLCIVSMRVEPDEKRHCPPCLETKMRCSK